MPCERRPMRYGHSEGHTDVCFDEEGKWIVTCGSDGDVRIWDGLDDDDPKSINVGEKAYALALHRGRLVTAASNNTVQIHTFPDGDPDGILTRFTTNATHVAINSSGSRVAAGSGDFLVKVVEVSDSSKQKTLRGHEAPVLSVALDPKDEFLASSSCDGSVAVWRIDEQARVTSWNVLQKSSDVINSKSLCRLAWQPSGKLLAVPVGLAVQLYERDSWSHVSSLSDDFITKAVNVVIWSPCGKLLAAGSVGGNLAVWDVEAKLCVERQKHEKGYTVCGMAWHPSGVQIAYTDTEGCLGLLDGVCVSSASAQKSLKAPDTKAAKDYDALFDEEDDGLLDEEASESHSPVKKNADAEGDDEDYDMIPTTARPRNRGSFLDDDENSLDTGSVNVDRFSENNFGGSAEPATAPVKSRPAYDGPVPTPRQKAFQPSSTPAHLMHRFMVWNSVGIVRGYNDEHDNAIDVEFHDTAIHHAMHLSNSLNHTMVDLSQEALLLACEGTEELSSKLQCSHFSTWDTCKEWTVDLPKGEDVCAVCLGQGWAAAATSALLVRLFSIGGVQREMFSLPGPVVCMVGHGEQLLIAYHRGTGFDGEQCLGVQLLQFGRRRRQVIHGEPLPLSVKSYLAWMGFTAEGTPCFVDSEGVVRLLNRSLGNAWTPVCHTRENCKSKSDHYWVVGVHESPQQLRCIPCKGSRFPPTLPRPAVAILPFKLPYCHTATEKGQLEEQYWRSVLFHNHYSFLSSSGYEIDEEAQNQASKEQQELLMKMFALACKMEREFRCMELAEMMTQSVVTLAIRYATSSRRMALAQRLGQLALEKANQLQGEVQEQEDDDDEENYGSAKQNSRFRESCGGSRSRPSNARAEEEYEEEVEHEEQMETEEPAENRRSLLNPFNKGSRSPERPSPKPVNKEDRVNPFKVSGPGKSSAAPSGQPRVANVLDTMTPSSRKPGALPNPLSKQNKSPVLKPLVPRPKSKTQATLLQMNAPKLSSKKSEKEATVEKLRPVEVPPMPPAQDNCENRKPKTGFQLWLEENRKNILANSPDLEETDVIKEAMGCFRQLSAEDRLRWTERAKGDAAEPKKRKREEEEETKEEDKSEEHENEEASAKKKKPLDTSAKLSAFAFNKS
ncbi:WD repeat and HMG-box DNA-binding protein 1 isoform X2 [Denticeps clupeoides]|uniref:WD repeat and HMG-box DNA-binding protein 1 isoform X2 n=1 Tax=Denticeps clupeoides TaxID=299321 RepID=UPI0010A52E99|nr:WD repeat and HMG-box DNA-binding protein 1 isoform X2 [Denticeps clupeoides]